MIKETKNLFVRGRTNSHSANLESGSLVLCHKKIFFSTMQYEVIFMEVSSDWIQNFKNRFSFVLYFLATGSLVKV